MQRQVFFVEANLKLVMNMWYYKYKKWSQLQKTESRAGLSAEEAAVKAKGTCYRLLILCRGV